METNDTNTPPTSAPATTTPAPPNKAAGNQLTTALIVIIVVLLFVMLMLSMNGQLFQSQSPSSDNRSTDLETLTSRNAQLRADANAERARQGLPPLPEDSSSARMAADRIQRDATTLAALAGQWQDELEAKDTALRDLQSQLTSRDENAKRLYAQIASLQTQIDQQTNAGDQLVRLSNDLKIANNQIDTYRQQLQEFQARPSSEQMTLVRKQLNESIESNGKLKIQVDSLLEAAKDKVDRTKYEEVTAELARLRPRVNAQRYTIQRLRAQLDRTRLFIESEKDIPAEAARLYAKLRTLEGANKQQLVAAYEGIKSTLGAEIIHRQTFLKGSAQITFDREKVIQDILEKRKDSGSFFLVVGYASKSGGAENNRKLSANRATTVASLVNLLKAKDQKVRAVYLGETARFSPTVETENQICEVWEIKP